MCGAQSALTSELQQLNCLRKGMYKALIPPSVEEHNRPRRPKLWACIAYTCVCTSQLPLLVHETCRCSRLTERVLSPAAVVVLFCAFFVMVFGFR